MYNCSPDEVSCIGTHTYKNLILGVWALAYFIFLIGKHPISMRKGVSLLALAVVFAPTSVIELVMNGSELSPEHFVLLGLWLAIGLFTLYLLLNPRMFYVWGVSPNELRPIAEETRVSMGLAPESVKIIDLQNFLTPATLMFNKMSRGEITQYIRRLDKVFKERNIQSSSQKYQVAVGFALISLVCLGMVAFRLYRVFVLTH